MSRRFQGTVLAALSVGVIALVTACSSTPTASPSPSSTAAGSSVASIRALLPDDVKSAGVIEVGTRNDAPPGTGKDASGKVVGYEVDLMAQISKILGVKFNYTYGDVNSLIPGLQANRFQAANGAFGTNAQRQQVVDYVSYAQSPFAYVAVKDKNLKVAKLSDLCGLTVAAALGTQAAAVAQSEVPKCPAAKPLTVSTYANTTENLLAIKSGRADVYFTPNITAIAVAAADPTIEVTGVDTSLPSNSLGISFIKGSALPKAFQAAINHLIDDKSGVYVKILKKSGLDASSAIKKSEIDPER